ncbi:MAG: transrane protein EpsH [Caulobacteraceae bacterium]|jgi:exosortase|nr:transrane protein EpsH [Caulobacteraceae bacterium]
MTVVISRPGLRLNDISVGAVFLAIGFAALTVPTLISLAQQSWSHEFGAYGPIVLVTGVWLLWRQAPEIRRAGEPGNPWLTAPILILALLSYAFGRAFDFLTLEAAGVYGAGIAILQSRLGGKILLKHWFPLVYLAFAIPLPGSLLADLTAPLKQLVSLAATDWLHVFGVPVARQGVTIFVAQYQLLVEDACSGMNSLVGLIAVSLLYIYLIRGSNLVYSLMLTAFVIPIAIAANIFRIMVLILLTYFFGNEVAQGILHFTAGMLLFATALVCVFGVDRLIAYVLPRLGRATS